MSRCSKTYFKLYRINLFIQANENVICPTITTKISENCIVFYNTNHFFEITIFLNFILLKLLSPGGFSPLGHYNLSHVFVFFNVFEIEYGLV
jgi:hypothetical protein